MSTPTISPTPGPLPSPAPGTHARTLFNQVLQTTNRNGSQYRPAAADEKAPALGGYASIENRARSPLTQCVTSLKKAIMCW